MNKPEISNGWYIFRFALIFLLSIVVMLSDIKLKVMSDFRYYLETALYPVMVFADSPRSITDAVTEQFKSREAVKMNSLLVSSILSGPICCALNHWNLKMPICASCSILLYRKRQSEWSALSLM